MFAILRHYGIPEDIVLAIKSIYDGTKSCVWNKGELSDFFDVLAGVMQGDVLAPYIFIIVIDYILKKSAENYGFITHHRRSTRVTEQKVNDLDFADDIALCENSIHSGQGQLNALAREGKKVGLEINISKTEYCTYNIDDDTPLTLDGVALRTNDIFKYLGSMMLDSTADIMKRRAQASTAFWKLTGIWNADDVPLQLKIKIFKVSVLSIFLYGCETWLIGANETNLINSFATKSYRYILHIRQEDEHITNEELYKILGECELTKQVQRRQLKKLGHYLRKPSSTLVNTYALYHPQHGHRTPGRPKTTFSEYIAKAISLQVPPSENEIRHLASDRKKWQKVADGALDT